MKKLLLKTSIVVCAILSLSFAVCHTVHAAAPTISVSNSGYGMVQLSVSGDPYTAVVLDYYAYGQLNGAGIIGYTGANGYFFTQLNPNSFTIPSNAQILVVLNGQQSNMIAWPGTYIYPPTQYYYQNTPPVLSIINYGALSQVTVQQTDPNAAVVLDYFDQSNQILGAGIIGYTNSSGYFSAQLTNSWYSIPNGAQVVVVINGKMSNRATWQSAMSYMPYQPPILPPYQYPSWLSVSTTTIQVGVGGTQNVTLYGGEHGFYLPNDVNTGIATGVVNGNIITIYGLAPGSTTVRVCQSNSYQCVQIYVTVTAPHYYYNNTQYYYPPAWNGSWYYSYPYDRWFQH